MIDFSGAEKIELEKLGIKALILFGSQAQGIANDKSDFDIFVIGKYNSDIYNKLYDLLSEKINRIVDIDIVFDQNAPLELKNHVAKYGLVLYEQNEQTFAEFRQKTMLDYCDFAPLRSIFTNATLGRISL